MPQRRRTVGTNTHGEFVSRQLGLATLAAMLLTWSSAAAATELPTLDVKTACSKQSQHQSDACLAKDSADRNFLRGSRVGDLLVAICSTHARGSEAAYSAMRRCVENEWAADRKRALADAAFSPEQACAGQRRGTRLSSCVVREREAAAAIQNGTPLGHRHQDFDKCFHAAQSAGSSSVVYL
jgi:hypothetical protein